MLQLVYALVLPEVRVPVAFVSFAPVSDHDVVSLIMNCPTKSSPFDPLPTFVLKECLSTLAPWIADFVNLSLNTATLHHEMKLAHVIPLLKKNGLDPDVLSNYRPVSLLKVVNDLLSSADNGEAGILALLDQSSAFDTVDHAILLDLLEARFGISGLALSWLFSYLNGRRQSVSIGGISSVPIPVIYGVPQGSVMGPILYILYNTPMHDISLASEIMDHYFADDAQGYKFFRSFPSAADQHLAFATLSSAITEQRKWLSLNRLKLNEDKTDALLVFTKDAVRKKNISSMR